MSLTKKKLIRKERATRDAVVMVGIAASMAILLVSWAVHQRKRTSTYERILPFQCPSEHDAFRQLQKQMQQGGLGASVAFVDISNRTGYRGLYTTKGFSKGETILSIPMEQTLSIATFSGRLIAPAMTAAWSSLDPDADQMLEVLALITEVLVNGASSPWRLYLCTLPRELQSYHLPISRSWGGAELTRLMPELSRLTDKRLKGLELFLPLFKEALKVMPGMTEGKDRPQWLNDQRKLKDAFLWAYAASKTRTVSLDLEKAEEVGATLLMQRALLTKTSKSTTPVGLSSGPTGDAFEVPILPTGAHNLRSWVGEIGVLVPVFDMVNHQGLGKASSSLAVSFKQRNGGGGVGVHFSLVAARDLEADSEVTFSYNPDDDAEPMCDLRWLAEYGFLPSVQDPRPERQCHIFNLTSEAVASAAVSLGASSQQVSAVPLLVGRIKLDETGVVRPIHLPPSQANVLDYISVIAGPPPSKMNEELWSLRVLVKCLEDEGSMIRDSLQRLIVDQDLNQLLKGSLNAIQASINSIQKYIQSTAVAL